MGLDIHNVQNTAQVKMPTTNEAPKVSEKSGNIPVNASNNAGSAAAVNGVSHANQQKNSNSVYEMRKNRMAIEEDMDKLVKQLMPDLGVKFKVHDSGQVITSVVNNSTEEVLREFPAEKILDLVHNMCVKLGIVVNKKI